MNALTILDVVLGLGFVYLAFSMICSTIMEWFAAVLARRARLLRSGIGTLLGDANQLTADFRKHPLIVGVKPSGIDPNYIASSTFARVLANLTLDITPQPGGFTTIAVKPALVGGPATLMQSLVQGSSSIAEVEQAIEQWFNGAMERLSGRYKRWTQLWTIFLAAIVVWGVQLDTLQIARELNRNGPLRAALAERAVAAGNAADLAEVRKQLQSADLPFVPAEPQPNSPEHLAGLALSILAISLGGPFWFEFLNRFVNLRQTGVKPPGSRGPIVAQ